jgi:hypothetical protein
VNAVKTAYIGYTHTLNAPHPPMGSGFAAAGNARAPPPVVR